MELTTAPHSRNIQSIRAHTTVITMTLNALDLKEKHLKTKSRNKSGSMLAHIDLPQEIKDGIKSRASMLSSTIKTLDKDDLIQEGLLLVYNMLAENPKAPLLYIMKAINYHFATIQKQTINYNKSHTSFYSEDTERELDAKAFRDSLKRPKTKKPSKQLTYPILSGVGKGQVEPIVILHNDGVKFKDIAAYLGKDPKTVRKILRQYGREIYSEEKG